MQTVSSEDDHHRVAPLEYAVLNHVAGPSDPI